MTTTTKAPAGRQLFDVELRPVVGSRFQPTGFPDIGPGLFQRPRRNGEGRVEWVDAILVESPQSMANRLEGMAWNAAGDQPVDTFSGLPYVRVVHADDGRYLTSSRTEAHRLASAFVKDATLDGRSMRDVIKERLGLRDDTPLAQREIARAVFALDPFCLVHGVFFAESAKVWPGQPKIARAVTGFVEAVDVQAAHHGGVKRDHVRHSIGDTGGSTEGYGSIPYHRTEWTAAQITASFAIDLAQIESYGLGESATALLTVLARWEIRALLDGGLRLRTACDLAPIATGVADSSGETLPSLATLDADIRRLVAECAELLEGQGPIEVRWRAETKGKAKSS
jgi:CRISPR-associated protein Csb1